MALLFGSLQLGLMYGLLAMGIYISFRILNIPDLTAEGSFTLGVAASAMATLSGSPWLGLAFAFLCGMAAGAATGLLQTKVGIHAILAGILTMSGLYTVNLAVMGASSNVSLIGKPTLFQQLFTALAPLGKDGVTLLVGGALAILVLLALIWFFKTHLGLCIRATGDNEAMVRSSSINSSAMKIAGLAVSNGCIALSGGIVAQYQGYADITSGIGILVVGLASVIIGEAFFGKRGVTLGLLSAIVGSVIYRVIISLALSTNVFPTYFLKLISAVIVAVALSIPTVRENMRKRRIRREGKSHA